MSRSYRSLCVCLHVCVCVCTCVLEHMHVEVKCCLLPLSPPCILRHSLLVNPDLAVLAGESLSLPLWVLGIQIQPSLCRKHCNTSAMPRFSCASQWPRTHYVAKDVLELPISLPPPSEHECWDYRHALSHSAGVLTIYLWLAWCSLHRPGRMEFLATSCFLSAHS